MNFRSHTNVASVNGCRIENLHYKNLLRQSGLKKKSCAVSNSISSYVREH